MKGATKASSGGAKGPPAETKLPAGAAKEKSPQASYGQSVWAQFFRRGMHLAYSVVLFYYVIPDTLLGVPKWILLVLLLFVGPLAMEYVRLRKRGFVFGLREYEKNRLASYAWFCIGTVILMLFFPPVIAAPCILVTAVGDVVIGVTKPWRRRYTFTVDMLACIIIFIIFQYHIVLAIIAGMVAFLAESIDFEINFSLRPNIFYSRSHDETSKSYDFFKWMFKTDDDFMMQVIPAMFLAGVYLLLSFFNATTIGGQPMFPDHFIIPQLHW